MKSLDHLPIELRETPQWVCCSADKIPKNPRTWLNAKTNDPCTWGEYEEARKACITYGFDYVGFVFTKNDDYFGIDLDHCLSNRKLVNEFVDSLQTYVEISCSGDGLHFIARGHLPKGNRRHGCVEMYSEGRFFVCTGNIYDFRYHQIKDCTQSIIPLHSKYLPTVKSMRQVGHSAPKDFDNEELIRLASTSKNGLKFALLMGGYWDSRYTSHSEADLALCSMLAFWTGRNERQMDTLFRSSGLMREKWDEKRGDKTYGQITISKAIEGCSLIYEPNNMEEIYKCLQSRMNK